MKAFVLGVGMTPFGRHPGTTLRELATAAAGSALRDAGLDWPDVGVAVVGNSVQGAMDGQHGIRGQVMLRRQDLGVVPVINVENACASASTALQVAVAYVASGAADIALAMGAEKMVSDDRARSLEAFEGCWDRADREAAIAGLREFGAKFEVSVDTGGCGSHSVFMDVYAAFARDHMARYGTTVHQLAAVSAKNHAHSVDNDRAQFRTAMSIEQVMTARPVVWPFTVPMCAPLTDGAAAAVVASPAAVRRLGGTRAVGVRALQLGHGGDWDGGDISRHVSRRVADRLWAESGVGPVDIDVAEVHDATAIGEIMQTEHLGLVPPGEGGRAAELGRTSLGGTLPVNPSGGLESRGHPIGATGLAQVYELVRQLRGECGTRQVEGARLAVAENGGGLVGLEEAAISMIVLEAAR